MNGNKSAWRRRMTLVGVALALLFLVPAAGAEADSNPNPGVMPINSHPHGMTYGQWSAAWWKYAYSLPSSRSPLFDATGGHCAARQPYIEHSKVFFLAGAVSGGTQAQSCTVPSGTMVFFPLLNAENDNGCPVVSPPLTALQLRSLAKASIDAAIHLHASVDGRPVQNVASYRVPSPPFHFTLPATNENLCAFFSGRTPSAPPGSTVSPVVGDGYYLMLAPLSPGEHAITFGGEVPSVFNLDVTYKLTVR